MANYSRNSYQYETSPRKLQPEYKPQKKKYPKKSTARKDATKKDSKQNQKTKLHLEPKIKAIIYVVLLFGILFAISYRNTVISEKYSQIKDMKTDLSAIEKENEQMEVTIESKTNLGTIEKEAKEKLGMQKLNDDQTIYMDLNKQDYVESGADDVVIEDNQNVFQKIISKIQNLF